MRSLNLPGHLLILFLACSCTSKTDNKIPLVVPPSLPVFDVLVNTTDSFDGYIFLRETKSPGGQFVINNQGEIKWFHLSDTTLLRVVRPYEDSYVALHNKERFYEISYDGDTLLDLKYGQSGFDRILHHDILKDEQGNYHALTYEPTPINLSTLGGDVEDTVVANGIIKLSNSGQKLWGWNLADFQNPLEYEGINRRKKDWGHANSLFLDDDGNYLISWRDFDQVWKVDAQSGEIIWKFPDRNAVDSTNLTYQQHSISKALNGDYMVFDNGKARVRGFSRALTFDKDLNITSTIQLPDSLFSFKQGSVFQFDEDRYLFSSTMTASITVTNGNGDILWYAKSDHGFYRAYYLDKSVFK